jgi:hypothetical protein
LNATKPQWCTDTKYSKPQQNGNWSDLHYQRRCIDPSITAACHRKRCAIQ